MLETFLDAARIGSGHLPMRRENVDLQEVVQSAADGARALTGERNGRQLDSTIQDGCIGAWDRNRMIRAVRALVCNALLYGDPTAPVRVKAQRSGHRVRMQISGGGPGPDADETAHMF